MKAFFLTIFISAGISFSAQSQVGVGTTTPNTSAQLDVTSTNKGFLPPRIALTGTADATTIASPATGLLIYNTATISDVKPGYYYFNGSKWTQLITTSSATQWTTSGSNVYYSSGNVGVGTSNPQRQMQVTGDGTNTPLRLENTPLLDAGASSYQMVIDNNGDVYKNTTENVAGQIIRIGINNNGYNSGSEAALRFNSQYTDAQMGNAPNGAKNFINTITSSSIATGVVLAAGNGTPARTTDQINLPAGVYRVTLRLDGSFTGASGDNKIQIKFIVNNNEYSLATGLCNIGTTGSTTGTVVEVLNLNSASQLDFAITPNINKFTFNDKAAPSGGGNSYRSLIMIERLR